MATTITPQTLTSAGISVTRTSLSLATTYEVRVPPGGVVMNFRKTAASDATINVVTPGTVDGLDISDRTITVPATTGDVAAIFTKEAYANSEGNLQFTVTGNADSLTVAAFERLGP